jgi:hypothetical protein
MLAKTMSAAAQMRLKPIWHFDSSDSRPLILDEGAMSKSVQ